MRKRLSLPIVVLIAVLAVGARAEAAPITGSVTFGGVIAPTNFLTTNFIDVLNNSAVVTCAQLSLCTGSYAPLNGSTVNSTYNDFNFNPLPAGGISPLWSFTNAGLTYTFNLLNITSIMRSSTGIIITGNGTVTKTGFDNTSANWSFSADDTQTFAFSSTTSVPVPDGGTTSALLGGALLGLGLLRRRIGSKR